MEIPLQVPRRFESRRPSSDAADGHPFLGAGMIDVCMTPGHTHKINKFCQELFLVC